MNSYLLSFILFILAGGFAGLFVWMGHTWGQDDERLIPPESARPDEGSHYCLSCGRSLHITNESTLHIAWSCTCGRHQWHYRKRAIQMRQATITKRPSEHLEPDQRSRLP